MCSAPYFSNERLIYMKSQQQRGGEETAVVGLRMLRSALGSRLVGAMGGEPCSGCKRLA